MANAKPRPNRLNSGMGSELATVSPDGRQMAQAPKMPSAPLQRPTDLDKILAAVLLCWQKDEWFETRAELRDTLGLVAEKYRDQAEAEAAIRYLVRVGLLREGEDGEPLCNLRAADRIAQFLDRLNRH